MSTETVTAPKSSKKKGQPSTEEALTPIVAHPAFVGVTSQTHPHCYNAEAGTWYTPETKKSAFKADGTPTKYVDRAAILANRAPTRPLEERVAEVEARIVKFKEKAAATLKSMESQLEKMKAGGGRGGRVAVDPAVAEAAYRELQAGGMTPQAILDLEAKLAAAKAFVKGKSAEELAALTAPAAPPIPPFLAPPGVDGTVAQ